MFQPSIWWCRISQPSTVFTYHTIFWRKNTSWPSWGCPMSIFWTLHNASVCNIRSYAVKVWVFCTTLIPYIIHSLGATSHQIILVSQYESFQLVMGVPPSHHPFTDGMFPYSHGDTPIASNSWMVYTGNTPRKWMMTGVPLWLRKPPYLYLKVNCWAEERHGQP